MPYIKPHRREQIAVPQPRSMVERPLKSGELTWLLTEVIGQYRAVRGDSFSVHAEIVAALEQAKDEYQRRVIHPFENDARRRNGDCYP